MEVQENNMKIKVTYEKIFDSDEHYIFLDKEELEEITFEQFKDGIIMDIQDYPNEIIDELKFEEIK